jgi:hypothetical protein
MHGHTAPEAALACWTSETEGHAVTFDIELLKKHDRIGMSAPWRVVDSLPTPGLRSQGGWEIAYASYGDSRKQLEMIADIRNALPDLISEIETSRAELAAAQQRIAALENGRDTLASLVWEAVSCITGIGAERDDRNRPGYVRSRWMPVAQAMHWHSIAMDIMVSTQGEDHGHVDQQ